MAEPALQQQPTAYAADGSPIAPEDTAAAVREGRGFFQKGAKVYARDPDGDLVTVAPEEAHLSGYQVLSPKELAESRLKRDAESASGLVKTGLEGATRGATMGLLGPEQFYDSEGRRNAKARQQYNPGLSAGSEVAGALGAATAASILSGGAAAPEAAGGVGARLAALAGRGALTPFRAAAALGEAAEGAAGALGAGRGIVGAGLRLGARGAVEGAVMGAGHEVSQAALDDVPLTAERLLAGAWDGAKMGGAFGAGLGVLGAGVGKAGRAIVGRMAETGDELGAATGSWAERATFKQQVGNQGKFFDKATKFGKDPTGPARIGRKLLDADMPTSAPEALRRAEGLADDAVSRLKQVAAAADDAGQRANVTGLIESVDDQISKLRETPFGDFQAIADRVEKQIAPFRERFAARGGVADDLDRIGLENTRYLRTGMRDESLDFARKAYAPKAEMFPGPPMSAAERAQQIATKEVKPVRVEIYPGEAPALGDGRHRMAAAMEAGAKDIRANVVTYNAEGEVINQTERLVSLRGGEAPKVPELKFSELWELRKRLDDTINWEAKQQGPAKEALAGVRDAFRAELDDTLARAADGGSPEMLAAWKKATEDYGDFALIKDGLKGLIKQRGKNRAISPSDYAAGGLMTLLGGGSPVAGMAMGAASAGVHKLLRERGLGVMAKIADRMGGVAGQVETAAKVAAMVETPKRLAAPAAISISKAFDTYSSALTTAQADPAKFADKMATATADLALRAPEVASQIQKTMLEDLAYLQQLHPAPSSRVNNTLTPQAIKPAFYAFDQKKAFVDAATALDNPVGVFDDIARGELPLTKIKALKDRRPGLWGNMRETVIKYTTQRSEELPFNRRMLLGVAFEFPSDWSLLHMTDIQTALAQTDEPKSPNDPTAAPSKLSQDPGADMTPKGF